MPLWKRDRSLPCAALMSGRGCQTTGHQMLVTRRSCFGAAVTGRQSRSAIASGCRSRVLLRCPACASRYYQETTLAQMPESDPMVFMHIEISR